MYNWPIIKQIVDIFSYLLRLIHPIIPNYGWAIVVLTLFFRLLLSPLDIRSKISMKKQAALQPKIAKINEKYKNDKEKAAQKTMELYRQEHASPMSGCLPALIQWPLLVAFFGALSAIAGQQIFSQLYHVMINQGLDAAVKNIQPWLWVHNVWAPDTFLLGPNGFNLMSLNSSIIPSWATVRGMGAFANISQAQYNAVMAPLMAHESGYYNGWFILPLLAGFSSWIQIKLSTPPQTAATTQQNNPMSGKTMQYIFPLISVFFTASSNAAFSLYWITSNVIAIATYKGVDLVWSARARKREQEEQAKHVEEEKTREALIARNQAKLQGSSQKQLPAKPSAAPASEGKQNPKEGKKQ